MRRVSLILLFLLVTAVAWGEEPARQHIRLRVLHDNTPRSGVTVKVIYPDGEHTNGTMLTLTSNSEGFVETDILSTVFWVTVPEENPDVVGREFRFAKIEKGSKRWDIRPNQWANKPGENQR